ncbi:MAG TPA: biotin-dependent carboxyltransferase family protein, partial [Gemmatimonadaceae bacterium]|nr:biotin-dependent carboxyltransferase family protein [Gemmatimonadaceae bacterium]
AAVLEWALGGGAMRIERDCAFCFTGASARVSMNARVIAPCTTTFAGAGDEIVVEQILAGRFMYFGFAGGVDVPVLLGSRSTYLPGKFGGLAGRTIKTGDTVDLVPMSRAEPAKEFHCAADMMPRYDSGIVHITAGPQAHLFDDDAWRTFTASEYRISSSSDRTGYRMEGPPVGSPPALLPSEAGCPGAIQVPGDGLPIALMADAPTVGGYAKIAVVSAADMPILAQRRPGESIRFELITPEQSHRALKRRQSELQTIRQLAQRSSR